MLGFDRVTVKFITLVPDWPSFCETSLIAIETGSSSTIVMTPWPSRIVALVGFDRLTRIVSFPSFSVSPVTETATVLVV